MICGSWTCKPNSVRLAAGRSFLWAAHYCAAQATYPEVVARRAGTRSGGLELPPYLVLLRVGFALPAALLPRRCALTAPFHPYLSLAARAVCFLWHFPSSFPLLRKERARMGHPPGRYPAHCSAEFGLSSALRQRPSDPAANRVIIEQGSKMPLKWTEWRGSYPSRELSWSCLLSGFAPQSSPVRTPRFPRRDNSSSSGW